MRALHLDMATKAPLCGRVLSAPNPQEGDERQHFRCLFMIAKIHLCQIAAKGQVNSSCVLMALHVRSLF